jgi:16S rRNA (guanine(966)-N(2))-methyltransferase RsmD
MRGKREGKPAEPGGPQRARRTTRPGAASVSKGPSRSGGRFAGAPAQVRIIGGQWKRTPLAVVDAPGLRPSPDRVRETVFNWIAHFIPDPSSVSGLDLFAGTGALGFELASRGAAHVTLVERNPELEAQLQRAKGKLGADAVTIVRGDALAYARTAREQSFDVVFLDPPFDSELLGPALKAAARLLSAGGLIYAESGARLDEDGAAECGLRIVRAGRAGHVHFHLLQRA